MTVAIIAGSILLFLAGLWLIVRWGGLAVETPAGDGPYRTVEPPGQLRFADTSGGPTCGVSRP